MKKGIIRIIFGSILIFLQILAMIGNEISGSTIEFTGELVYDVSFLVGYLAVGVSGALLLIFGIKAYKSGQTAQFILHKNTKTAHKVIKYVFVGLLGIYMVGEIYVAVKYYYSLLTFCLNIITVAFMLVYLLFYQGKKPSFVFSTAIVFMGITQLFNELSFFSDIIYLYDSEYLTGFLIDSAISVVLGILYLIIGIKLYKEKFTVSSIKILGWITFALDFVYRWVVMSIIYEYFIFSIDGLMGMILPVIIFVYTSIIKVNNVPETNLAEKEIKFCRICGEELLGDSNFCSSCGTPITVNPVNQVDSSPC